MPSPSDERLADSIISHIFQNAGLGPQAVTTVSNDICLGPCYADGRSALLKAIVDYQGCFSGGEQCVQQVIDAGKASLDAVNKRAARCPGYPFVSTIFTALNQLLAQKSADIVATFVNYALNP